MTPKKPSKKDLETRVEELENQLKKREEEAGKYMSQLKYAKADLDNFQKQSQKRVQDVMDRANGSLLQQLLPVLDELEILATKDAEKEKLVQGLGMVLKKTQKVMESEGVHPIEADGLQFDPFKHEAVLEVETDEEPDGYVLEEIMRGYMYKDRVLRASVVKVARSPRKEADEEDQDE
ncbi:nucleotide exchange factor GrpE [Candidatus Bathyarchaeota archaeon]|nr:nucleotide exchange factor GrpE [Candidatus Bathyarchaeota archaeon]